MVGKLIKRYSPFYDFARRKLRVPPRVVDYYLDGGGAHLINRTVVLKSQDGMEYRANVGFGHRRRATQWVNEFNDRVVRTITY